MTAGGVSSRPARPEAARPEAARPEAARPEAARPEAARVRRPRGAGPKTAMFVCGCGHVLKTNVDPIPGFGRLLTDAAVAAYREAAQDRIVADAGETAAAGLGVREVPAGKLTSFADRVNDALHEEFLARARHVVDCPACGNLYLASGPGPRDNVRLRAVPSDLRPDGG